MKKFIISILCVAVFFTGLGSLVQNVGAKFKSDERALELVRRARIAIGGEESITNVKSLSINGKQTMTFNVGGASSENIGEVEIALQLPNQLMKMMKFGHDDGSGTNPEIIEKDVRVIVMKDADGNIVSSNVKGPIVASKDVNVRVENAGGNEEKIIIKKADGTIEEIKGVGDEKEFTTTNGDKVVVRRVDGGNATFIAKGDGKPNILTEEISKEHTQQRQNELLRLTLSLLMSAPQGIDVAYTYGGEGNVDSTVCNVVNATFGGETFKIFLDKSTNLPVAMNYSGMQLQMTLKSKSKPKGEPKEIQIITSKAQANSVLVNYQVKFSDYRSVNGMNLPHRWATTSAGNPDETFDVTSYEVNPANIAEKFSQQQPQRMMIRMAKPQ
jgi:hypothetical protein